MLTPQEIVDKMMAKDFFSQWLGIERLVDEAGKSVLQMVIRKEMLNGFGIAHGGICYALADSCLAFAANAYGYQSVSIETSISHTLALREGDIITATAREENLTRRIGLYRIVIVNQHQEKVAIFKGTVYRTEKEWE
jgi:acyl-CoA thioesterase